MNAMRIFHVMIPIIFLLVLVIMMIVTMAGIDLPLIIGIKGVITRMIDPELKDPLDAGLLHPHIHHLVEAEVSFTETLIPNKLE